MSLYAFGKNDRLCSKTVIDELFRSGTGFKEYPIRIVQLPIAENDTPAKLLISVPKKRFKKAISRNLIKRLIREAYRLHRTELMEKWRSEGKYFALAFVYIGTDIPTFHDLNEAMQRIVEKLNSK